MNSFRKIRCAGFSLVELMVALVVGLLLIGGTIALFVSSKRAYTETERFSWIQENARFASVLLSNDLRITLFMGEGFISKNLHKHNLNSVSSDCSGFAAAYGITTPIASTVVDSSGNAFGCITDGVAGTSVLVVKHARPQAVTPGSEAGTKTYVISNNTFGVLYDGADGTPPTSMVTAHSGGGTINAWEYQAHVYYIRQASQCSSYDAQNSTAPCLARKALRWDSASGSMSMVTEDVVDGVEAMQLEFGQDTDSDENIDTFTKASGTSGWTSAQWGNVAAVRFSLLLREEKEDPFYDASIRTYGIEDYPDAGDTSYTPSSDDHFHRSMIQTTVLLRNPELTIRG